MLPKNASLRHVALAVNKLDECEQFYNLLGMQTELKVDSIDAVDKLYQEAKNHQLTILNEPKTFGIGTRGFSVLDPDGIEVAFTYHPPMAEDLMGRKS